MIRLGPITIMSTKTRKAYRRLANEAYDMNQYINFIQDWTNPNIPENLQRLRASLADAISRVPASDIGAGPSDG